ncbi:MAG: hypothetical protein SF029_05945 [bacterium]|nr:hypothetical protein [bacterium]
MSVFDDYWRECLREHYKSVIRENDQVTLRSLKGVMNEVGFREDELRQMEIHATMRTEDMPDDFVPNLDILQDATEAAIAVEEGFQPHPLECQCPACVQINLIPHDEEGQPVQIDPEESKAKKRKKGDEPKQLSLF